MTDASPVTREYVEDILGNQLARALPNNLTMLPSDKARNSLLLIEKFHTGIWFCPECDDGSVMNMIQNDIHVGKKDDCKHIFAAKILGKMAKEENLNLSEKDQVFLVQRKPKLVAVVYPKKKRCDAKGATARPGVIEKNAKMSKPRCRTCSGREGCFHLVIFNLAKEEETTIRNYESVRLGEKENLARKTRCQTDLIDDDANLDEMPAEKKTKTENKLNPRNFAGAEANVFKQAFEYPPSTEDKLKNNKINKEENLFPNQMMIPPGKGIEKCSCGNLFDIVTLESRNPVIHHSRPTHDSRTGLLSVHFLETSNCDCKKWYHGELDKLVRTSAAPAKSRSNVQFVSVDFLNEYMTSLFGKSQEGKSINAFVNNKNILNCDERGEAGEISKQIF